MHTNFLALFEDFCHLLCGCDPVRIVPRLGVAREHSGAVLLTPEFQGKPQGEIIMAFALTATQQVALSVLFKDKKGNPAVVQGAPAWAVDNSELLALTPGGDGMSCMVAAVGPLGTALVSMTADADLGDGVTPLAGTFEVEIGPGTATVVEIAAGTPEEQP